MTGPIRGFVTFVGLAALACALTACDGSVGGSPTPASTSGSASTSSSAVQSDTPLAARSACKLHDQALAGQDYPPATQSVADPEHACGTQKQDDIGLDLQDGQSYDQGLSNTAQATRGKVRQRAAIFEPNINGGSGGCAVNIEVKPKSRAIVVATLSTGSTDDARLKARAVAEAIDALLPKTS